jgi:hypothetical protein
LHCVNSMTFTKLSSPAARYHVSVGLQSPVAKNQRTINTREEVVR